MNKNVETIISKIKEHDKIAFFHHNNIDGDSFSCSYGLLLAVKKAFPNKKLVWVCDEEEMRINFPWLAYDKSVVAKEIDNTYLAIIGDTSSINKVVNYDQLEKAKEIICFDHHQNDINIKHDFFWKDSTLPASSLQAIEIAMNLGVELNEEIAFNLSIGVLTDTGNFTYSLGDSRPVKAFSQMLEYISNEKMDFFWNNMRRKTMRDIDVERFFFDNLKFDGKVAYVVFDKKDTEAFSDINFKLKIHSIGNIEGYPIWAVFVIEAGEDHDRCKLHFRSNGPNVSSVAIEYNGGGHIRAAGAKVRYSETTISDVLKKLNNLA